MFLTDFHTRKYTGGIISRVGIFLTVTPVWGDFSFDRNASTHYSAGFMYYSALAENQNYTFSGKVADESFESC